MSVSAKTSAGPRPPVISNSIVRLRRGSLAVLVLLVAELILGLYVNLYVSVPAADHGSNLGRAISGGPVTLSVHAALGLLLGLGAVGILVQAALTRRWPLIVLATAGLLALAVASMAGASFVSGGDRADSMAMSVMTGVALLCYTANLYLLPAGNARR
jgi:hypothetical protein